jgi:GxxExxY protein
MEDELTRKIIGAAIEVHRTLGGPGLLESIYEEALINLFALNRYEIRFSPQFRQKTS